MGFGGKRPTADDRLVAVASRILFFIVAGAWVGHILAPAAPGQVRSNDLRVVELTNGMRLIGRLGSLKAIEATLKEVSPNSGDHGIILIADELRDTLVSRWNVANQSPYDRQEEKFEIWQHVHRGDANSSGVGEILGLTPFDRWGRRSISVLTARGVETTIQGITEITPRYVRLEGVVNSGGPSEYWDMYLALNSVPLQTLVDVLHLQIQDPEDANERMRLVDFFAQAGKFNQAERELQGILRDFPGLNVDLSKKGEVLRGQVVREMLEEARLRAESGQPGLAGQLLIPLLGRTDLPSAVLVEIADAQKQLDQRVQQIDAARQRLVEISTRAFDSGQLDDEVRTAMQAAVQEITSELRESNLDRLSTFERLADDADLLDTQKTALAISGWLVGAAGAIENTGTAQSMYLARNLVMEYLQSTSDSRREEILHELEKLEAGAVEYLDGLIRHVLPPLAPSPEEIRVDQPMEIPITLGRDSRTASYLVQLPPEYDPWRRYPCLVTLGASTDNYTTPEAQIEWWCGPLHERFGIRSGHASRRGYIVIAPRWTRPGQPAYEYSEIEHGIVLKSLRDAMRRFSIDSDRVFLSGHFDGGTAAWDIGQAHPEHWAGVIPISARAGKYMNHMIKNGKKHTSWYFVSGSRDFISREVNANIWNTRCDSRDYQSVIVLFRGRGTEKFPDELDNLFQWMSVLRRLPDVEEFECTTLRTFDNYFWWLEVDLSQNKNMIPPETNWETAKRSAWTISGSRNAERNELQARGSQGGSSLTVWLSPGNMDFSRDLEIVVQGKRDQLEIKPSRRVILEDARLRSDRQHPRWARIDFINRNWQIQE